jgi:hypothetical protein
VLVQWVLCSLHQHACHAGSPGANAGANRANGSWPVCTTVNRDPQPERMTGQARTHLDTSNGAYGSEGCAPAHPEPVSRPE